MQPLLLATGTIVSALMLGYAFHITGNSRYMLSLRELLIALGQPAPDVISAYEHGHHVLTENEWVEWQKKGREKRRIEWGFGGEEGGIKTTHALRA